MGMILAFDSSVRGSPNFQTETYVGLKGSISDVILAISGSPNRKTKTGHKIIPRKLLLNYYLPKNIPKFRVIIKLS